MTIEEILHRCNELPAASIAVTLNESLAANDTVVVTAPPGAGKSTLLPLTMYAGNAVQGKLLLLEPRRLAARQIAERMADVSDEKVGETVGYRVRFESRISTHTRIEVITEGILVRMLCDDPTLDGVGAVIFDEFHERSLNSDLAFALVRKVQQMLRPDLRVVLMSATIDAESLCNILHAPHIGCEGKMFPVAIEYAGADSRLPLASSVSSIVEKAHRQFDGDILVFLPGQAEIEQVLELLEPHLAPTRVLPLYGNLSPKLQRDAIAPSRPGERKVVLATSIAETSLTIEGVRVVVDSGLCRKLVFDPRTELSRLETLPESLDIAAQRAGRAGRVSSGTCIRLWAKQKEHLMPVQRQPEITDADLAPLALSVAAFGESDILALPWITPPAHNSILKAQELLVVLGAINVNDKTVTPLGKRMAEMPCHPRIARMILGCKTMDDKALACDIAALLEEKDPMSASVDTDLTLRIIALRRHRKAGTATAIWQRISRIASEYRRITNCAKENNSAPEPYAVGSLVAAAYPGRIAVCCNDIGGFNIASGGRASVNIADSISAHNWIAIAAQNASSGSDGRVSLAAPLHPEDIPSSAIRTIDNVAWDFRQGCVVCAREKRVGKLVIESRPIHDAPAEQIVNIICDAVCKDGLSILRFSDDDVQQLQRRVAVVGKWHPELDLPDLSTAHLMQTAHEWLPFWLRTADGHLLSSADELRRIDLRQSLWNILPYNLQELVDRIAPTHIQVPTGSRIRIDYREGAAAPVVSVRLQECFGMQQTPCVDDGKQPLLMELLSPGFKPVQLTQDIASFWQNAYFEVRKELRRRYPKHSWPENPLQATAVRGVKKQSK